jgi:hypothetical protein
VSEAAQLELVKGAMALLVPVLSAVLLYIVGRYLTDRYQEQKKRAELSLLQASQSAQKQRELQLEAAGRFYELYGEFFAVWKEWSAAKAGNVMPAAAQPFRLDLYRRACVAEGHMEAVLVRVVTEFSLDPGEVQTLGRFRQAYQTLREAIREDRDLGWNLSSHPRYAAFKRLAATVASLLARRTIPELPAPADSAAALAEVTDNKWESGWDK